MTVQCIHERKGLDQARGDRGPESIATVMTLGALHAGHAALVERAREAVGPKGQVIVTVFVNPLQFGAGEDFAKYPRTLQADVELAQSAGADIVYAPDVGEIYGTDNADELAQVRVHPGPLGQELEGASRPGHFAGVLTVVAILMHHTRCGFAPFGEKDYQQLTLVRAMVRDLGFDVEILPVSTLREPDGLALSSRNRYLSAQEREVALTIPRALDAAKQIQHRGAQECLAAAHQVLRTAPDIDLDYLVLRGTSLQTAPTHGPARLLVAARVGSTRLLDNIGVDLGDPRQDHDPLDDAS